MGDFDVRFVRLDPMRVASVRVESETPERDAWARLRAWAEPRGFLKDPERHPVFGFNNPGPLRDRKEYGYEFWIRVDADIESGGEIEIQDFPGGLYAVTSCKLQGDPSGNVLDVWMQLWHWVQNSKYKWGKSHELEKILNPLARDEELVLDLYLPIQE